MTGGLAFVVLFASALGCGIAAGVFFAFSTFIMPGLARLTPAQGIAAMQSINIAAINRWFMGVLFGTAAGCVVLTVHSFLAWRPSSTLYLLAGSLLYLAGNIIVTIACNVPLNNALAAADPASAEGATLWANYLRAWTAWNHVRTVTAIAASALLTKALLAAN